MFGWKETSPAEVATEQSPRMKLLDGLNMLVKAIDFANNPKGIETVCQLVDYCDALIKQLSPTEQSKCSLYWVGVTSYKMMPMTSLPFVFPTLLPTMKTNILNTINSLS